MESAEQRSSATLFLICVLAATLCANPVEAAVSRDAQTKNLQSSDASGKDLPWMRRKSEIAARQEAVEDIEAKLTANLAERTQTEANHKHLIDAKRSTMEIQDREDHVAKEMQSPAMAKMLATMWKELRMFEVPSFKIHTKEELEDLKNESEDLQAALGAAKAELDAAKKKKWSLDEVQEQPTLIQRKPEVSPTPAPSLQTLQAPPRSQWSFWQWPTAEQRTTWSGTAVYFCFGLMFAFLYNRARTHAKALLPQRDYRNFPSPDGFSFGLFDCLSDANICVIGCCCPCLRWADTLDRQFIMPFWSGFLAMFLLMLLHIYSYGLSFLAVTALGVFYRRKLYQHYQIEKVPVVMDIITWFFCQPCAIIQEAREASVQRTAANV